jgi:hypothetical protein
LQSRNPIPQTSLQCVAWLWQRQLYINSVL